MNSKLHNIFWKGLIEKYDDRDFYNNFAENFTHKFPLDFNTFNDIIHTAMDKFFAMQYPSQKDIEEIKLLVDNNNHNSRELYQLYPGLKSILPKGNIYEDIIPDTYLNDENLYETFVLLLFERTINITCNIICSELHITN